MNKRVIVVYHFFHPDNVVSSRVLSDFAEGLAKRGWEVTALTSNRYRRDPKARIAKKDEVWRGVRIHRVFRPAFNQSSHLGRLLNAFWLIASWLLFIARQPAYGAVVLGTDPQFGYFILPIIRLMKPQSRLLYWSFDLYPEAIIANGMGLFSRLASAIRPLTSFCYRRLDGIVDIGSCMGQLLDGYGHRAARATLVPWALTEPGMPLVPDPETRRELFGDAQLALLYSGTIGKAHEFECFIMLARELRRRGASVSFCFAGHGNRYSELRAMVTHEDSNISFAGFTDESQLERRLGSGDIHLISLRPGWEGAVVPSKFFGSLAAGKPILYEGSPTSAIKAWIDQYQVGYIINKNNVHQIADKLCRLVNRPELLVEEQLKAFRCYQKEFSREKTMDRWDDFLHQVLVAS